MKRELLLIISFFISLISFSQIQNEKGTLIINGQDTIHGSISYTNDELTNVTYRDGSGTLSTCTIGCVNEIILWNGSRYVVLDYSGGKEGKLFVKTIVGSDLISLYSSEENGSTYWYLKKGDLVIRLENNKKEVKDSDAANTRAYKSYSHYDLKYVGTLKYAMSDRPDLFSQIDRAKLKESDLIELVLAYDREHVIYINAAKGHEKGPISNWIAFAQYNNYGTYMFNEPVDAYSYGIMAGFQMYFSKSKRNSFKFALGYAMYSKTVTYTYDIGYHKTDTINDNCYFLDFMYEYTFLMTPRVNVYGQINFGQFGYLYSDNISEPSKSKGELTNRILLGLGMGFEYKTKGRLSFNVELNNLVNIQYIPRNFTFGIKYDIGKITQNILLN